MLTPTAVVLFGLLLVPGGGVHSAVPGAPLSGPAVESTGTHPLVHPHSGAVAVGKNPAGLAYDPVQEEMFVADYGSNSVSVVNTTNDSVTATISVGTGPWGVAYDSTNNTVFVANEQGGSISVINPVTNTVIKTISTGSSNPYPYNLAYDSGKDQMFVTNDQTAVLIVGASNYTFFNYVNVGNISVGIAYDPTHGNLFATMGNDGKVWVISDSTDKVTKILNAGTNPGIPAVDTTSGKLFVPNLGNNVTVFGLGTLTAIQNLHESSGPSAAATDPASGLAVIVNSGSSNATVLDEATYATSQVVEVGSAPFGVAIDPVGGDAFSANFGSGNVSYFPMAAPPPPTKYQVDFNETGLPPQTSWSVALNSNPLTTTSSSLTFSEPNGSYTFSVGAVSGYSVQPQSGTAVVQGGNLYKNIAFTALGPSLYTVDFVESGLPSGTTWTVSLAGAPMSSATTSIGYLEPNGTYAYHVGNLTGYTASPSVGSVPVNGADTSIAVTYTANASVPVIHNVTFSENGLPAGSRWVVHLGHLVTNSTTGEIHFGVPNGQYPWYLVTEIDYAPSVAAGLITVNNSDVNTMITFYQVYPLGFSEGQLPPGTNWSATVSSQNAKIILLAGAGDVSVTKWSDGGKSVTFEVSNGTFEYSFSAAGYAASSGQVTVNGSAVAPINVSFTASGTSGGSGASPTTWLLVGVGVVVVVVLIAVALVVRRRRTKGLGNEPGRESPPPG